MLATVIACVAYPQAAIGLEANERVRLPKVSFGKYFGVAKIKLVVFHGWVGGVAGPRAQGPRQGPCAGTETFYLVIIIVHNGQRSAIRTDGQANRLVYRRNNLPSWREDARGTHGIFFYQVGIVRRPYFSARRHHQLAERAGRLCTCAPVTLSKVRTSRCGCWPQTEGCRWFARPSRLFRRPVPESHCKYRVGSAASSQH